MFNQKNAQARKQWFFSVLGIFFPPNQFGFQPDCSWVKLVPHAWCQQQGCARNTLQGEGRVGQPILATLCHVAFAGGWFWNLSWTCLYSQRWFIPSVDSLLFDLPDFKATVIPLEKCEILPKPWILNVNTHTEEINLSLLLFLQGFVLFPCLPSCLASAGPYPWST